MRPVRLIACVALLFAFAVPAHADTSKLPDRLGLGVELPVEEVAKGGWLGESQVPFDYVLTGLGGGANTGNGWQTWEDDARTPLTYAQAADAAGAIPVIGDYQLPDSSGPCDECDGIEKTLANLNARDTMKAYFDDLVKLFERLGPKTVDGIKGFGKTAIVLMEVSVGGFAQQATLDNSSCFGHCVKEDGKAVSLKAAVARSGRKELAELPDTFAGYLQAIDVLRDAFAPNVLLSYYGATWATGPDIGTDREVQTNVEKAGLATGSFLSEGTGTDHAWDLISLQSAGGDAGWHKYELDEPETYWNRSSKTPPNFDRFIKFVGGLGEGAKLPVLPADIGVGNQVYKTMDNTEGHWQDNRIELTFANIGKLRDAGVIGIIFGGGPTMPFDALHDGITNPEPVCTKDGSTTEICPNLTSAFADDDGGFLRVKAGEYYKNPETLSLPTTTSGPTSGGFVTFLIVLLVVMAGGAAAVVSIRRRQPKPAPSEGAVPGVPARYEVKRLLGEGATKSVYLAHDSVLGRDVALSVIKIHGVDASTLHRVSGEARAIAQLGDHPNIVGIYDSGESDGRPFIVSQYLPGGSVQDLMDTVRGPLPLPQALRIAADVARALEHAHASGVVHRDVKAANVWMAADGSAKLGDFGLAAAADGVARMTQPGTILGTVTAMAPEQARGEEATPSSDLYSLGVLIFEMVTGSPPFTGDTLAALVAQHLNAEADTLSMRSQGIPPDLDALTAQLLSKVPSGRPASATEVRSVLDRLAKESPRSTSSIDIVAASVQASHPDMSAVVADDGTVTLCFTDIERSTEMNERLGDQRWIEVLRRHNRVVREHVTTWSGAEVSSQGDGFLLAFASPRDALHCAIEIERGLNHVFSDPDDPRIRVRIGIHTGEAITEEANFFGRHVNLAARIGAEATGGEVLVSGATRSLVPEEGFAFGERRSLVLKGLSGSHDAYPLVWDFS